jgi:hypothetical protein
LRTPITDKFKAGTAQVRLLPCMLALYWRTTESSRTVSYRADRKCSKVFGFALDTGLCLYITSMWYKRYKHKQVEPEIAWVDPLDQRRDHAGSRATENINLESQK